jgi:large subunit ribosomal protein L29
MKAKELRELSLTELKARRVDETEALQDMKFNHAVAGQLENPARISMTKREIARLNTIIHEKENQKGAE